MDLLEELNNCEKEEVQGIIDRHLKEIIPNEYEIKSVGMNSTCTLAKFLPFKGMIYPKYRIEYNNGTSINYSMDTMDYYYEFGKFVNEHKIKTIGSMVSKIEIFLFKYFGRLPISDMRTSFFEKKLSGVTDISEYDEEIQKLNIGDLKGMGIAMCTEKSAIAQNILSLFGLESYYCIGCVLRNDEEEEHCFNVVRGKDCFKLVDYSLCVPVLKDGEIVGYAPFQQTISLDEIEDFLLNNVEKTFDCYNYVKTSEGRKKVYTGEKITYRVGYLYMDYNRKPKKI